MSTHNTEKPNARGIVARSVLGLLDGLLCRFDRLPVGWRIAVLLAWSCGGVLCVLAEGWVALLGVSWWILNLATFFRACARNEQAKRETELRVMRDIAEKGHSWEIPTLCPGCGKAQPAGRIKCSECGSPMAKDR